MSVANVVTRGMGGLKALLTSWGFGLGTEKPQIDGGVGARAHHGKLSAVLGHAVLGGRINHSTASATLGEAALGGRINSGQVGSTLGHEIKNV